MRSTVYIMMFGWPIMSLLFFMLMRPRQAILLSVFMGWLLLPQANLRFQGLPDYSRATAVMLGVMLGIIFFDYRRLTQINIRRFDIPIIVLCVCPLASSISNDLGIYDGISAMLTYVTFFGAPYLIGRLYFSDSVGLREFSIGFVIAMLCYTPLILFELRMSPQLHRLVYGYLQIPFHMIWRLGWYRPPVFLSHGLELGLLLSSGTLTAIWLWQCKTVKRYRWISAGLAALSLLVICLLCRALNGYVILFIGLGSLYLIKITRMRILVVFLVLLPSVYVFGRVVTNWNAAPLVQVAQSINPLRARSLQSRISHEISLIDKALRRPFFGWGGWGRNRADEVEEGAMGSGSVTDSFWIIIFGQRGLVGLISAGIILLWPSMLLLRRLPVAMWCTPEHAPAAALSMVMLGFAIDCLVNAMASPIFFIIAGGLIAYKPGFVSNRDG